MTPKNTLWALLALMLACGMLDAQYSAAHMQMPAWWMLPAAFLLNFLPYYWYRLDSQARRFNPPRWMTSAVVAVPPLGIPLYLLSSRRKGTRMQSLARMSAFVLLMPAAGFVGALSFLTMPG